uniref:Uncharacterized protein n=1 Tax=Rubinisphaera brasiliensis (strain ATCC 49424 / DSM 5305 / JCM 21570 / IAM 15109 / NBRC 103401 / IFAM 1448) TaxID=756272 RepID=F0SI27_RUBBR|nr:hypothetical protein Plabr_4155 [Rubinisphaera brasiliensis DSM 5305]
MMLQEQHLNRFKVVRQLMRRVSRQLPVKNDQTELMPGSIQPPHGRRCWKPRLKCVLARP